MENDAERESPTAPITSWSPSTEKRTHQQFRIETVGLGASMFT